MLNSHRQLAKNVLSCLQDHETLQANTEEHTHTYIHTHIYTHIYTERETDRQTHVHVWAQVDRENIAWHGN